MQKYAEYFEKLRLRFAARERERERESADQNKREILNLVLEFVQDTFNFSFVFHFVRVKTLDHFHYDSKLEST